MKITEFPKINRFITRLEEEDLATLLTRGCSKEKKDIIKKVIKYNFLSYFCKQSFSSKFEIDKNGVRYNPKSQSTFVQEIREIRDMIIRDYKDNKL